MNDSIEVFFPETIPHYERTALIGEWMIQHNGWRSVQWIRASLSLIVRLRLL